MGFLKYCLKPVLYQAVTVGLVISMMSVPAFALDNDIGQFYDVPETHAYYETILGARQSGFVNGINAYDFQPDRAISLPEFMTMYANIFSPETFSEVSYENGWTDAAYQVGRALGLVSQYETVNHIAVPCTWGEMVSRVLDVAGLPAYSVKLWGEEYVAGPIIPTQDAVVSAKHYGLFDDIKSWDYTTIMTRAEALQFLYNLRAGESLNAVPEIMQKVDVSFEQLSTSDVNDVYGALRLLPEEYITYWNESKWTMNVVSTPIFEIMNWDSEYTVATGLCSADKKGIWLQHQPVGMGQSVVLHEFGHFLSCTMQRFLPNDIFEAERDTLSTFLRPYAATSKEEALADIFCYCVQNHGDEQAMEEIKSALPQCYEFVYENFPEIWDTETAAEQSAAVSS